MFNWRCDFESEEHQDKTQLTKNAILRYIKKEVTRRVSPSSSPESVAVTDCRWLSVGNTHPPTYVLCGLSNGTACLLNTINLSKAYMFDDSDESLSTRRSGGQRMTETAELVGLDCVRADAEAGGSRFVICAAMCDGVYTCVMDTAHLQELKQRGRGTRVTAYPSEVPKAAYGQPLVRFNPLGNTVLVVLPLCEPKASPDYMMAVLSRSDDGDSFTVQTPWTRISARTSESALASNISSAVLLFCGWVDDESALCVWSDGLVQLLCPRVAGVTVVGQSYALLRPRPGVVKAACCTSPNTSVASVGDTGSSAQSSGKSATPLIAVLLENNVLATFTIVLPPASVRSTVGQKRSRAEADGTPFATTFSRLHLQPTQQTYCTEDIPVRDISFLNVFSWTVVAALESGALLFLDARSMNLLTHRPLKRIMMPDADRYTDRDRDQHLRKRNYFCCATGKPFGVCVVEHDTIVILKSL